MLNKEIIQSLLLLAEIGLLKSILEKTGISGVIGFLKKMYPKKEILNKEQWLWCLHCERFFQVKDLKPDVVGGNEGCAFEDCDGAGLGIDIFIWDEWAKQNNLKHWPKSTSGLYKGLKCSLYPEENKK